MKKWIGEQEVTIEFVRKRVKNINLRYRKDGTFVVSYPFYVSIKDVEAFVNSKEEWMKEVLVKAQKENRVNREGVEGPILYWFGEKMYVRYIISKKEGIETEGDIFTFYLKEISDERIRKVFRKYSKLVIQEKIEEYRKQWDEKICARYGLEKPQVSAKYLKSLWGICYPGKRVIHISSRLVHYPLVSFEYVLLHEYVHLLVRDHSSRFYQVIQTYMPNYKEYDSYLK